MTEDVRRPFGAPDSVPDWDTLARFVARENSADEMSHAAKWLDANPAERALLERLSEVTSPISDAGIDVEAALAKVHARMSDVGKTPTLTLTAAPVKRRWRPTAWVGFLAAAAIVGILVTRRQPTASAPEGATVVASRTFTTDVGKRDSITLADGSRVLLGPDSRLTIPGDFGIRARGVELHGDAYFDVRHDAARPFAVRVGSAVIQDIGTTFTVESDDANATVVTVVTGSVRLRGAGSAADAGVILGAGERGSIDEAGRTSAERSTSQDNDLAWTTGKLVFRDASLSRVAAELHRWYGIRLHVADQALLSQHVSTTLLTDQPVDQVLQVIGLSLGVRIERQGDSAIVMNSRSSVSPPR